MDEAELKEMASVEESHWWFAERRNLLRKWVGDLSKDAKILDVGAGNGSQSAMVMSEYGLNVISLEFSEYGIVQCKLKGLPTIQADLTDIPVESEQFEAIIAMDVLEHIPDHNKAVQEIVRILKPNGKVFITVPAFQFLWSAHDERVSHQRRYSKKEIKELVEKNGIEIQSIRFWNSILFPVACVTRLFFNKKSEIKLLNRTLNKSLLSIVRIERNSSILGKFPGTTLLIKGCKKNVQ